MVQLRRYFFSLLKMLKIWVGRTTLKKEDGLNKTKEAGPKQNKKKNLTSINGIKALNKILKLKKSWNISGPQFLSMQCFWIAVNEINKKFPALANKKGMQQISSY